MEDRQWAVDLLRRAGYTRAAEEAERVLPAQVTLEELQKFADKYGISRGEIISQMGGSP